MIKKVFIISSALIFQGLALYGQTAGFITDSINRFVQSRGMDSSALQKMVMRTDGMGDYQRFPVNPLLKIALLDSSELKNTLAADSSHFRIVLIWSCWSRTCIAEMIAHKELFDTSLYALYLVSADLNNSRQRDTINKFLTSLGVSANAYQIRSPVNLTDLQNSKATASFINCMTGHSQDMVPLNVCTSFPYAIIYDQANDIVKTFDGHFSFADLTRYKRHGD